MVEHVIALGWINLVRAILGLAFGGILLWRAQWPLESMVYGSDENLSFDRYAFLVVGTLTIVIAHLRAAQSIGSFLLRRWGRVLGLALALFDIANLLLFPLSTALGLYGLVVYRHPDTLDHFRSR
ncbi:MAG TPA: hypothetical protein VMT52_08540 [Planctomycetota bacterium]|nr:hypothetical protein [Planctomycetota bacterium]